LKAAEEVDDMFLKLSGGRENRREERKGKERRG